MKANSKFHPDIKKMIPWGVNPNDKNINLEITNNHIKYSGSGNREIQIIGNTKKVDFEVKKSVSNIIKWNSSIDESKIKITVEDGWITLEGKVDQEFKRTKAELLAKDINGVNGVTNLIIVSPERHS
ncbi:MAG: BON domain-containing protein [Burkholderiales bacterium]|nr:BON domain-containing protein [Bacteroidia bacterium]